MSDHPSESRCKHDRRIFDACSECENEAELALQDDQKNYVLKLKAETARLTAELVRVEKELEYNAAEMSKSWDYYARFKESRDKELTAAETRAKSAEDRCERLVENARSLLLDWPNEPTGEEHTCSKCGEAVGVPEGRDFEDGEWCWDCWQEFGQAAYALLAETANQTTPPGDAGKGGG